ncbi:MAG: hypothetical protein H6658_15805 [Ardenticatenaceae bacterium]|nr:hypothetical protein [Ardenticatenaceae bacterium]
MGKYYGSVEYHLVYCELIRAAQYGGLTTYQAVAQIMGLPLQGSHMGREVGIMLGEISENELAQERPMLSAIVVGVSGVPGPGFAAIARQLGKLDSEDKADEMAFWEREKTAVYQTWAREFSS